MTDRSRVRFPAGAAGEFSSPESTFCADSYAKSAGGRLQLNKHAPYVCGFA